MCVRIYIRVCMSACVYACNVYIIYNAIDRCIAVHIKFVMYDVAKLLNSGSRVGLYCILQLHIYTVYIYIYNVWLLYFVAIITRHEVIT